MLDVFEVADLLVSWAVQTHGDAVDLIGYYGSYAQGTATARSDLDIFYIPVEGQDPPIGCTALVSGILFDFWPIPWDIMEDFATGQRRGWSMSPGIVHHAKVLYSRSDPSRARFQALKQRVLDLQKPAARAQMVWRALDRFQAVALHLGNLRLAMAGEDLADVKYAGWQVVLSVWECLALANQTLFDRGWRSILEQADKLEAQPAGLQQHIATIVASSDPAAIALAAEELALGTRQVLRQLQASLPAQRTVGEQFHGAYPEIHDQIGKVLSACERQQPLSAAVAAWFVQSDLSLMLSEVSEGTKGHAGFNLYHEFAMPYRANGFPDLLQLGTDDLAELAQQAALLDDHLQAWLKDHAVNLQVFETLAAFARWLDL